MKYNLPIILSTTLLTIISGTTVNASFWDTSERRENPYLRPAQHTQVKSDAAIARVLAADGDTPHETKTASAGTTSGDAEAIRLAQIKADAAMAWKLHTEGFEAGAGAGVDHRPKMPGEVLLSYAAYDKAVRITVKFDMNVHAFNAATNLKGRLPVLLKADEGVSDPTMSFAETRVAIESSPFYKEFEEERLPILGKNMDALGIHLTTNPVETTETGVNIEEIFSRTWSLAMNRPDFARQVFVALCDNTETGGGCYPGHAGRLARLYVNFLRAHWQD